MKDIRIALAPVASKKGAVLENIERMDPLVKGAGDSGAKIICFPELSVSGYSLGKDMAEAARPVPGDVSQRLADMARRRGVAILAGLAEKGSQGRIFASHLAACPDGSLGVYRKTHIAPPERGVFSPGRKVPVFETSGVAFGIQLCYDAHFPGLSTQMAEKGVDVIFMPHASPRGDEKEKRRSWMRHLPARAFDNAVFVAAVNASGEYKKGVRFPGIALVIGPSGRALETRAAEPKGLVVADLKAKDLRAVRNSPMAYFLPHRRKLS
ncbi:Nitrilase/cyanide hydratase and apolipoprotein N-acyltransferase [Candidatus Desulfarcum epimagneticum]|uniref:Nitrilase/cyanide hydratase and apolipoprotein N-acyltransferase n=1 Tax=uncultured Desulfobacteraceae bacterium TaxID=218296 RepID=A0A484HDX6_9BACT|nr:Nitrilase/cyanide hydratase and apolipoprotein N-acyltransferase [uncultured Desulfobacteraceae bacterium]